MNRYERMMSRMREHERYASFVKTEFAEEWARAFVIALMQAEIEIYANSSPIAVNKLLHLYQNGLADGSVRTDKQYEAYSPGIGPKCRAFTVAKAWKENRT